MKKNTCLILLSIAMVGCSLVDKARTSKVPQSVVPKQQIDFDLVHAKLADRSVNFRDSDYPVSWDYERDFLRCFAPTSDPEKVTDSTAEISINIGAASDAPDIEGRFLYGKAVLHYTKENDKWKLERLDSTDLRIDEIPRKMDPEIKKFFDEKIFPLCDYYQFETKK